MFTTQSLLLTTQRKESSENILGTGENAGNQHFSPFPKKKSVFYNSKRDYILPGGGEGGAGGAREITKIENNHTSNFPYSMKCSSEIGPQV